MQAMQSRVEATENQESDDINVELQMRELWQRFFELGTEMIITKTRAINIMKCSSINEDVHYK